MLQSTRVVAQAEYAASSQHSSAASLISRGLYDDLHSFAELEQRITNLGAENTKIVGDAFEIFVEAYLATHQKLQVDTVWLVGQVPLEIRKQLNLPKDAKGIDGVFRTRAGSLVPYQVKFRSNRNYLTYTEIASFLGLTERAVDRIVFTNSNELAQDVKNRDAMRTVRGIDFDDLTEADFEAISGWLRRQPVVIPKPSPHSYQTNALEKISETFAKSNRAHVVMACGTGKTLVALWAVEQLKPKTVLVLVPSLTLLQQTLDEWSRHNCWGNAFSYICVCSDPTVASNDGNDQITFHRSDADFRVDTDPKEVRRFLQSTKTSVKVIFSTYQSSAVVSQALRGLAPIDIAIFDEAHKTTGPQGGSFAHCLSDENIRIRKRLFLTATPRHYDIRHRDREGDFRIISMDDETVYGPRAYTLTFGSAANQGIICNYKVVISVVDGQELNEFALKHGITLVKGDLIGARWVANQIAVERAIEKTRATRGITFHSRVSSAREFASDSPRGIQQWLPSFFALHVNGTQSSSERKQLIRSFREADKAVITNARCLVEGIDVPGVDFVAFIDPRHSKIDIAQATGRAMRKPRGSDKTTGYVVVPLFLDRRRGETLEDAFKRSEFSSVATILNAMQEQDDELVQVIQELQEAEGQGDIFNPRKLADKVEVLGPSIDLSTLTLNIFVEIRDSIGTSWDEWYGCLKAYRGREGHCLVPAAHKERNYRLGLWVSNQRANKDKLAKGRRQQLDDLGFVWNAIEAAWERGFDALRHYKKQTGDCYVPDKYNENGFALGNWVGMQRANQETLAEERRRRLDDIGFIWEALPLIWEKGFGHLKMYKEREGHCGVPRDYTENEFPLGNWVVHQRAGKHKLSEQRRERLTALGFDWNPRQAAWEKGFEYLQDYKNRFGHCRVPGEYKNNGYSLGAWVQGQRTRRQALSEERKRRLDGVGFDWERRETAWEEGFNCLAIYAKREGHCRVPATYRENGYLLGRWVRRQRRNGHKLPSDRRQLLDALRFVWDPLEADWEEGFNYLNIYKNREGHCRVTYEHKENGHRLGQWVRVQRVRRMTLSDARKQRLDNLGFVWDPFEGDWNRGFSHLKAYKEREGHCRVPGNHKEKGYRLGKWVTVQRFQRRTLSDARKQRLDDLGFVWANQVEEGWNKGFGCLKAYKEREGHCRVPANHREEGYRLGKWVRVQRFQRRTLSDARKEQLNHLGFVWDPLETAWKEGLHHLKSFKKREGHCRVPVAYKEGSYPLGQWCRTQRTAKDRISPEHRLQLDELGFAWEAR